MNVLLPRTLAEALQMAAAHPDAELLAGGTDLMVEINFGRKRPESIVVVDRLPELRGIERNGTVRAAAGVTYTALLAQLDDRFRAMREMARTVGSPQIRNAGTVGGNLGTCSPAGDTLPVLAALDARVVLRSASTHRRVPFTEYMTGPKKSVRRRDELVVAVEWDEAGEAQVFMKAGTRNAMVIAIASLALVVDRRRKRVGIAIGSSGPTIIRAGEAERFAEGLMDEAGWDRRRTPSDAALEELGSRVAAAARPIDDVRGTAAYRRHVLAVMAQRAFARAALVA